MPLTDEQQSRYIQGNLTVQGTWWYHLPMPGEPRLYIVAATTTETHATGIRTRDCELRELEWNGHAWDLVEGSPPLGCPFAMMTNPYSSFWLLGDSWLGVLLHPRQEVVGVANEAFWGQTVPAENASIDAIRDGGLTVDVRARGNTPGVVSRVWRQVDLYEFLHVFAPVLPGRAQTSWAGAQGMTPARLPVEQQVPAAVPVLSRFDREPPV